MKSVLQQSRKLIIKIRVLPQLQNVGFGILPSHISGKSSVMHHAKVLARHPAVLILISFLLTGLIGTWLADHYQRQQREQDAHRKSMDEVRLSIDNTNQAFSKFIGVAFDLEEDLTAGASGARIEQDRISLRKVRHRMESTLTFETARISQQMPYSAGNAFVLVTSTMLVGTGLISDCLTLGKVIKTPGGGPYGRRVACNNKNSPFTIKYVDERISRVDACISQFYGDFRPNPFDDFLPDSQFENLNNAVRKAGDVCNNEIMLGVKTDQTKL